MPSMFVLHRRTSYRASFLRQARATAFLCRWLLGVFSFQVLQQREDVFKKTQELFAIEHTILAATAGGCGHRWKMGMTPLEIQWDHHIRRCEKPMRAYTIVYNFYINI